MFNRTALNCKLWFCSKKNRSPAIMWNVAVSPFQKDLMFDCHDSKYKVTATLFCVSFEIWAMVIEHEWAFWWVVSNIILSETSSVIVMGKLCLWSSGKRDPFLLIPDVRNVVTFQIWDSSSKDCVCIIYLIYFSEVIPRGLGYTTFLLSLSEWLKLCQTWYLSTGVTYTIFRAEWG